MDAAALRAAAERMRADNAYSDWDSTGTHSWMRQGDAFRLASAYLVEHLADSDEPVTAEWVENVLPSNISPCPGSNCSAEYRGNAARIQWIKWKSGLCVYVNNEGIVWQAMTRGEFRSLCRALRIPLMGAD